MKNVIAVFVLLFRFLSCFSQTPQEVFLNEVNKQIFPASHKIIYLDPEAQGVERTFRHELKKENFGKIAPVNIVNELSDAAKKDTIAGHWNCQNLKGVTCISFDSFKLKGRTEMLYFVSKPIFSSDQKWCVISIRGRAAENLGYHWGEAFLFHKANGKWEKYDLLFWET